MSDTVGHHYAQLLEDQLNAAIRKKLEATSAFKKNLAGIRSVDDAKHKGYAPANDQIAQIKNAAAAHAEHSYSDVAFRNLPAAAAVHELVAAVMRDITAMNQKWQQAKRFVFDKDALENLASEARALIAEQHEPVKQQYFPG